MLSGSSNIGDRSFAVVYETYVKTLYSYGISLGFLHDDCLDAIQDVFYNIFNKKIHDRITNLEFYLLRSLKNRLSDMRKARKNEVKDYDIGNQSFTIKVSLTTENELITCEEQELLKNKVNYLLNRLSDRQKEAIYLRYMLELEYDQIAQLLNITPESARKLICRGIGKIRKETASMDKIATLFFLCHLFY